MTEVITINQYDSVQSVLIMVLPKYHKW